MIAQNIHTNLKQSSLIRAMFEEGENLRRQYGPENVFDFSLGNPDPEPSPAVTHAMKKLADEDEPNRHGYMNNAGYPEVRAELARALNRDTNKNMSEKNIIMTCGAGGALNVTLKTLLNPGEEVIVFTPYFGEYKFYIENYNGKKIEVPTNPESFEPNLNSFEQSISPSTKAVIINSPNNPTGIVYSEKLLKEMAQILEQKEKEFQSKICVISDEPYSKLVYDGIKLPQILNIFKNSVIINSFSKSHSLPGERVGFIAVNDEIENSAELIDGLIFSNRILGYVNAPAFFQRVLTSTLEDVVDKNIYEQRRNVLYDHLTSLGFSCVKPQGAFYLFPKSPIADDLEFKNRALKHNLIVVPGRGFGCPGYFRIAYCVGMKTIENSLPAFTALAEEFR